MATPEDRATHRLEGRAALIGFALAKDLTTNEALMAGVPVPRDKLNADNLRKLGEPLTGPDFVIEPDQIDFYALRLAVANGASPEVDTEVLRFQPVREFAAIDEPSAHPLLGNDVDTIIPAGGTLMLYGDGGAGKTTLEIDLLLHLATGTSWLGLPIPHPVKLAVIENEGPRGKFRQKLQNKLNSWEGKDPGDNMMVLEEPWGSFLFTDTSHRAALAQWIDDNEIELLAAGPLVALGMKGGGTPDEVSVFMTHIAGLRAELQRSLAVSFVHHTNKGGDVSGAWGGITDTLAHIQAQGNGHTRCFWRKVRWGSTLHEATWSLLWRSNESFELEEKEEVTDADFEVIVFDYITEHPGCSWRQIEQDTPGNASKKRKARDTLISQEVVENRGKAQSFALYATVSTVSTVSDGLDTRLDTVQTQLPSEGGESSVSSVSPLKGTRDGRTRSTQTQPDPDADIPF